MNLAYWISWDELVKEATGKSRVNAGSYLRYYAPLHDWLRKDNEGQRIGWSDKCPNIKYISAATRNLATPVLFILIAIYIII